MADVEKKRTGAMFETDIQEFLAGQRIHVQKNYKMEIGVASKKHIHRFDLGSDSPKLVVECKRHTWVASGNTPSAKMSNWNEAMYYLHLVPAGYRRMFFVLMHRFTPDTSTLVNYYIRTYEHLIPPGVEIWEFDESTRKGMCVYHRNS